MQLTDWITVLIDQILLSQISVQPMPTVMITGFTLSKEFLGVNP